jgi:hypothetical protein
MRGIVAYNETCLPLLTCDNPAVQWKKNRDSFICGVDQFDPDLIVSCPLARIWFLLPIKLVIH